MAHKFGRKVAVTGRSMENILKVSTELGYLKIPNNTLVDINTIKQLPKHKICIVSTGSQGENMSALYRMAFSEHRQVEIQAGDRVIISASAIPGNEKAIGKIINELYRKGADVVYDKLEGLHVSGHACQEELKLIHGLVHPRFFIPVHGEQRHLQAHSRLAQSMGCLLYTSPDGQRQLRLALFPEILGRRREPDLFPQPCVPGHVSGHGCDSGLDDAGQRRSGGAWHVYKRGILYG